jgi:hypothetical protein
MVSRLAYSSTLKTVSICFSEASVEFQSITQRYIPEDIAFYIIFNLPFLLLWTAFNTVTCTEFSLSESHVRNNRIPEYEMLPISFGNKGFENKETSAQNIALIKHKNLSFTMSLTWLLSAKRVPLASFTSWQEINRVTPCKGYGWLRAVTALVNLVSGSVKRNM